jgi:hypothetical protein
MRRTFFIFTIAALLFDSIFCLSQDISNCDRTAFIGKCENLALPENFQELFDKYNECLGEQLNFEEKGDFFITYDSPPEDVAIWEEAQKNCEHLKPDYDRKFSTATPEIMVSNLQAEIASILTCDRFHIVNHKIVQAYRENSELAGIPVKEDKSTIPEYFFEATYDCVREPVIRPYVNQNGETINEEIFPSALNIRMYFDGEQKELVKEWTTNSTSYSWTSHMNKMFENKGNLYGHEPALMRKEVPITNLLDDFEKRPLTCSIKPEKEDIDPGEEIEIYLSGFRDKESNASREFNRIVVHCSDGKILNGERHSSGTNYRVFKLDQQSVKIQFKAPDNKSGLIQIAVFNSCDILPVSKTPLRETRIGKQIAINHLSISQAEWNGRLTYELSTNFNCTHGTARVIEENKHQEQKADLKFSIDKLEFGLMNVGIIGKIEGNGQLEASIDDNREETGKDYHQIKQIYGSHTETISAQNIIITIVGKTEEDPKAMQERWEQMVKTDPMAVINEMKKMQEKGKDENENLEIVITIIPPDPRKFTATYQISTDSKNKQERINESVMMPLMGMSVKFDATLDFHEDGSAEITGGYDNPRYENNGKPSSTNCPPISVKENVQFMLFKRKTN